MQATHTSPRRQAAFACCGAGLWVETSADDVRLRCDTCHDRFCVPCATAKAKIIAGNLRGMIDHAKTRFVTLTLRCSDTPLRDQISRIYRDFSTLRRRNFWREHVSGGAAFLEVKVGKNSGMWHVHLHILCDTPWLSQADLSKEWHAVTGDSYIVDVRAIATDDDVARYVVKYVTKPASTEVFNDADRLQEMLISMRGRHLCFCFGTWRGRKLADTPETAGEWKSVGSLETLLAQNERGEEDAARWIAVIQRKWPTLLSCFGVSPAP